MPFDPVDLEAPTIVATQLQKGRRPVKNLSEQIIDIVIETSVQGASTMVLSIMDAKWQLLTSGFISISEDGFLEPIDINYNPGGPEPRWWRLAACEVSTDTTAANLSLTFEDRIVSLLRDKLGPKTAKPGTTREQFIASLVREIPEIELISPTYKQELAAGKTVGVGSSIALGAQAPAAASSAKFKLLTPSQLAAELSPARRNPNKSPGIDPRSRKSVNRHLQTVANQGAGLPPIIL